ncbi:membrane protein [Rhodococcus olei]|uniref:Membrane protein n=1 Tax=Rhodococcus olei TaxID=2161675 RepID=A0ABP8PA31_9NOCA
MSSVSIGAEDASQEANPPRYVMRKLPHITALFWALKIVATTLGETGGDLLAQTLEVGYLVSTVIFLALFLVAVVFQLRARQFRPAIYWTVIALTSTAGTTLSDLMNRTGGIGYAGGALVLTSCLAIVFYIWWRSGQTLDVENVATFKGELLYWVAILFSNSLGTSSGDFLADSLGIGFRQSALILSTIMLLLLAAHYFTRINGMLLFWIAFVLTRPLGATAGDALSKPRDHGGLNWGTTWTTAALLTILVVLIVYQSAQIRRHPLDPVPAPVNRRTGEPEQPNGALVTDPV